ncbi:MAG: MFS transporter [Chloroflexi bacterium]|nr:MFS transporter [Chloroflexota bacterium]
MENSGVHRGEPAMAVPGVDRWWFGLERKWWVLIAIGVGAFMGALDGAVVNAAVPLILRSYGAPLSSIEWVVMAYLLTIASLLLTFGRLGDIVGHKGVYIGGFAAFILGSLLCGLAPSEWWLVGFRAFQALGAAMLIASAPAILTNAFPASQRGQALGTQGTMTYLGVMVGPALGGFIADHLGWQWIFYINVPIGIVATALALAVIPKVKSASGKRESFDPSGAVAMTIGLALLLLALSHGQEWGWSSPAVIAMIVLALVLLVAFTLIERVVAFPMVNLGLFRDRLFSAATSAALINYICAYAVAFLMPFYLLQGRGYSPTAAGLLLTGMSLTMAIAAPLSGALSDRIGSRLPSSLGMAITAVSLLALAFLRPDAAGADIVWRIALVGLGTGLFVSPNSSAIFGSTPPQQRGVASGIVGLARTVGMVLGVAIGGAVFNAGIVRWTPVVGDQALFYGIREAFVVAAAIAVLGTAISLVRGPSPAHPGPPETRQRPG